MNLRWEERAPVVAFGGLLITWAIFVAGFLVAHSQIRQAWNYQLDVGQQTAVAFGIFPIAWLCCVLILHLLAKRWHQIWEAASIAFVFGGLGVAWLLFAAAIFGVLWVLDVHWGYQVEFGTKLLLVLAAGPVSIVALVWTVLLISGEVPSVRKVSVSSVLAQRHYSDDPCPGWFKYSDQQGEEWEVDLKTMTLKLERYEVSQFSNNEPILFSLRQTDEGEWRMRLTPESWQTQIRQLEDRLSKEHGAVPTREEQDRADLEQLRGGATWQPVSAKLASELTAQYGRFLIEEEKA